MGLQITSEKTHRCVAWLTRACSPLQHGVEVSLVRDAMMTLQRLMELLAHSSNELHSKVGQKGAAAWHPVLLLVSGAIAAIADAIARRNPTRVGATRLTRLLCGYQKASGCHSATGLYGLGIRWFEQRVATLDYERPEYYLARSAILDYFLGLKVATPAPRWPVLLPPVAMDYRRPLPTAVHVPPHGFPHNATCNARNCKRHHRCRQGTSFLTCSTRSTTRSMCHVPLLQGARTWHLLRSGRRVAGPE